MALLMNSLESYNNYGIFTSIFVLNFKVENERKFYQERIRKNTRAKA